MTDTDKYEGTWKIHGMEYWKYSYKGQCEADTNLIHDAPLLLEEVKKLREELRLQREATNRAVDWHLDYIEGTSGSADEFLDYVEGGEEE